MTGSVAIRSADVADLQVVMDLYAQLSSDVSNVPRDFPAIVSDENSACLIAELDGQPVGMALCYVRTSLSSGRKMVIDDVVVDAGYRRAGIGRQVVEHCIGLAADQQLDSVELSCSLVKPELHRFYERLGFRHRMRFYSLLVGEDPGPVA